MPDYYKDDKMKTRLMNLHQDKLELALTFEEALVTLNKQEIEDLSEFLAVFLYD